MWGKARWIGLSCVANGVVAVVGSLMTVVTTTLLVIMRGTFGVTRMFNTIESPELMEPKWQISSGKAMAQKPCVMVAKLKGTRLGSVWVDDTVCDTSGPWLTSVTVWVKGERCLTELGVALLVTSRSARSGFTVVSSLTKLLLVFGSVVAVVATTWLVIVPGRSASRGCQTTLPPG